MGMMAAMKNATADDNAFNETLMPHLFSISPTQFSKGMADLEVDTE